MPDTRVEVLPVRNMGAAHEVTRETSIYVYEAPVRIWHWVNALCIVVLAATGFLIGRPPPAVAPGATDDLLFGYLRFTHFAAGQVLAIGFLFRILWAFVGNHHARQVFLLPVFNLRWWAEVWHEAKWYAFLTPEPKKYAGHNPLAQLAMFVMFTAGIALMILTGLALYAEGAGQQSWWWAAFGWVHGLAGDSMTLHTVHHLGMWVLVVFAIVHVYAAIREDIMSRQSLISTMISGRRMFKDDRP
ncbi:Ni/Fe-hydrogenase, b-type cytochrome subunit [Paracraurococcus lichenis]|uniref:Ni/Fe-hydrogenase, b-type cytochrome subunit n=1 Tax=Paracraurococcus lichenis TaxID=3064888 RepID=A0ABT9DZK0_9PROT|nr:Ni/Fe-hydrogenase, b-type cytochrome subunit [Paracraurococcus sp. LOR1-02]MDO9709330.1 Ni/Fe-hydrogenase, b-type cytochrome subunit [Paracraurococcus sp. LOR1-02]